LIDCPAAGDWSARTESGGSATPPGWKQGGGERAIHSDPDETVPIHALPVHAKHATTDMDATEKRAAAAPATESKKAWKERPMSTFGDDLPRS